MTGSGLDNGQHGVGKTVGAPPRADRVRWWQRAVPVGTLAVVALTVVALTIPEREIELSTSREPQQFVELYLTDRPRAVCAGDSSTIRFRMVSHLVSTETLRYRVAVDRAGPAGERVRRRGRVRLAPGETKDLRVALAATPERTHDITIRLAQRSERLRIHCARNAR